MEAQRKRKVVMVLTLFVMMTMFFSCVRAWTGEIHGRVVCDVCGDSSIGPEDHILEGHPPFFFLYLFSLFFVISFLFSQILCAGAGAEVAVLCITKSGEVLNYQAFTDAKGIYRVAETMPESDRWDACLARPISSFHEHCTHLGDGTSGIKFTYSRPSGYSHTIRPFVYRPANAPLYCV
ncbi:hypothetical protein CK203_082819 [Vitis vinifera]|uniref:Pollen Ole e 1 allergen and extensin family protein n=1 Tax=Vitis vinifera TaxID=29760 RepID=A0A438DY31_VITVI|nr:hypothetical protein CK203_082819 [Vitis vinifera]